MTTQDNKKLVQDAYAAFGRGDIHALLGMLTPDVDWHGVIGVGPNVPQGGVRKGQAEVGKFFEQVGATTDFKKFEPRHFVAEGDTVVAIGFYAGTIKPTGKPFSSEWVMVFTIHGGKVSRFQEFTDSYGLTAAFGHQ